MHAQTVLSSIDLTFPNNLFYNKENPQPNNLKTPLETTPSTPATSSPPSSKPTKTNSSTPKPPNLLKRTTSIKWMTSNYSPKRKQAASTNPTYTH